MVLLSVIQPDLMCCGVIYNRSLKSDLPEYFGSVMVVVPHIVPGPWCRGTGAISFFSPGHGRAQAVIPAQAVLRDAAAAAKGCGSAGSTGCFHFSTSLHKILNVVLLSVMLGDPFTSKERCLKRDTVNLMKN